MPDQTFELKLIAALNDQLSGPLKEFAENIQKVQGGPAGKSHLQRTSEQMQVFGKEMFNFKSNFETIIDPALMRLGLVGGTAAAVIINLSKQVAEAARNIRDLKYIGDEIKMTVPELKKLQDAGEIIGVKNPVEKIVGISHKLNEIQRYTDRTLSERLGLYDFETKLREVGPDTQKGLDLIKAEVERVLKEDPQKVHYLLEYFNIDTDAKTFIEWLDNAKSRSTNLTNDLITQMIELDIQVQLLHGHWIDFVDAFNAFMVPGLLDLITHANKILSGEVPLVGHAEDVMPGEVPMPEGTAPKGLTLQNRITKEVEEGVRKAQPSLTEQFMKFLGRATRWPGRPGDAGTGGVGGGTTGSADFGADLMRTAMTTGTVASGIPTNEYSSSGWQKEGGTSDGTVPPAGDSGNAIPSDILAQARQLATSGDRRLVQKFLRDNGYPMHDNWCGDFVAAVVASQGGRPPRNAPTADSWARFGDPVEGLPQPGDIAVRKAHYHGHGHVAIVNSVDPKTGRVTLVGGNQGRWFVDTKVDRYIYRRSHPKDTESKKIAQQVRQQDQPDKPGLNVEVTAPQATKVKTVTENFSPTKTTRRNTEFVPSVPWHAGE